MKNNISVYLCYLLRHNPDELNLDMDKHGWVPVAQLIQAINVQGRYTLEEAELKHIVETDTKGRYRLTADEKRIKACQGHSLTWVQPELQYQTPPDTLYHGTTAQAYTKILASGTVSRIKRHAVHMQADESKAWLSAKRWHLTPVVLKIDASQMVKDGYQFGVSENGVWCTETVPTEYIVEVMHEVN